MTNLSLAKIKLSVRSQNVSRKYNFRTLENLINYYQAHKNFYALDGIGKKSNEELISICEKYSPNLFNDNTERLEIPALLGNIKIDSLTLSIRAYHSCLRQKIYTVEELVRYYIINGDFLNLQNIGENTNLELINICKEYLDPNKFYSRPQAEEKKISSKKLTRQEKTILIRLFQLSKESLSIRSKKIIDSEFFHDRSLHNIVNFLDGDPSKYIETKNVGKKSIQEIINLQKQLKKIFFDVVSENKEELVLDKYVEILLSGAFPKIVDKIVNNMHDFISKDGLNIFKILDFLIKNEAFYLTIDNEIFRMLLGESTKESFTLTEIAHKFSLSRERIRQKRNAFKKQIYDKLEFIKFIEVAHFDLLNLNIDDDIIFLTPAQIERFNEGISCRFTRHFLMYILSIILQKTHRLYGVGLFLGNEQNAKDFWSNSYLIKKKYSEIFDFDSFVSNVFLRMNKRISRDYKFYFESFLLNFLKSTNDLVIYKITGVCELLLLNEFELMLDNKNNLVFKRNIKKLIIEYIIEVLVAEDKPMNLADIYQILNKKYPGTFKSKNTLRGICKKGKGLIYFGRTSTYALKEWELEKGIKGGTIREIVEEYLNNKDNPIHLNELTRHVNKYRKTNDSNIISNLKAEQHNTFIFYPNSLVGLTSKSYNPDIIKKIIKRKKVKYSNDEKINLLEKYVIKNKFLPSGSGSKNEKILYNFLRKERILLKKGNLSKYSERIKRILSNYKFRTHNRLNLITEEM